MKFSIVIFFGFISTGCSLLTPEQVVEESYFVPVIRSDNASAGYVPTVTPTAQKRKEQPRSYPYEPNYN